MVSGIPSGIASIGTQFGNATSKAPGADQSFADVFRYAVAGVDTLQNNANQQISQMVQGKSDVDVGQVSVAVEKADVAFQLMLQVRNKVVSAYQDIEKMQF
jgi:flagellar hook-basal body complex protein FliE